MVGKCRERGKLEREFSPEEVWGQKKILARVGANVTGEGGKGKQKSVKRREKKRSDAILAKREGTTNGD